jgi:cellulose synthase/poly-beta-1,6-N-acetylglucosamine synthase-like glycosyltransferase
MDLVTLVSSALTVLASLLAIPVAVLFAEIIASLIGPRRERFPPRFRKMGGRIAVIIPAHNEGMQLVSTLDDVKAQLTSADRLVVVADNCSDDTAAIARTAGVDVVERRDTTKIGKGYALDCGLRYLSANPPDIVVMVDADCRVAPGTIDRLVDICAMAHRPVQALYLMVAPEGAPISHQVAEFAFRVKNWARPLGLATLRMPCQLTGTGMAFPWNATRAVDFATGAITEDLKLGLELTAAGYPPLFCPSAQVSSVFASTAKGADTQRKRWEYGHVATIVTNGPRLLFMALWHRNLALLALTIDVIVPPLTLLVSLLALLVLISSVALLFGVPSTPMQISIACLLGFALAIFLVWLKFGRDILPIRAIALVPQYVFWKVGLYRRFMLGKTDRQWTRTDRGS